MEQLYKDIENLGLDTGGIPIVVRLAVAVLVLATVFLLIPIFTIWVERKVAARFQNRLGPNRVGPFGLLQSFADVVKLLTKEIIIPEHADKYPYLVAPLIMVISVILIIAVIPITSLHIGTDLAIGALYVIAVSSLTTISVVMAGWGSNNKYALLGAFRTVAQLVSYEIPLVFSLLIPVLLAGTMSMQGIVQYQADTQYWFFFIAPTSALIFFIANLGEIGRTPFDVIEAESELVAGYMTEYSAMMFGLFMLAEFLHAFIVSVLVSVFFFGGWHGPFSESAPFLGLIYLSLKSFAVYFVMMWIRNTLPRFRVDQIMGFNWKFLVPFSIGNLLITSFFWEILPEPGNHGLVGDFPRALVMFITSMATLWVGLELLRRNAVKAREKVSRLYDEKSYPVAEVRATGVTPAGD